MWNKDEEFFFINGINECLGAIDKVKEEHEEALRKVEPLYEEVVGLKYELSKSIKKFFEPILNKCFRSKLDPEYYFIVKDIPDVNGGWDIPVYQIPYYSIRDAVLEEDYLRPVGVTLSNFYESFWSIAEEITFEEFMKKYHEMTDKRIRYLVYGETFDY